ncbi:superoxide dismutase [Nitrospirillum sp. BR 11752]|uniref:Superoxide dismutase n=1 Tax=Nitrospirillum amazonense TaxID=28077 RepID=A0A560HBU2_9PROT|nr:superoxide dismutase [Nitrospirillum amazonense]MEE3622394.1 superoxide dismutase [Nitrospirillum sp. BR 11752]TWB43838.1 Fe-Mn family superoxide dismutase [Nitrospirillum amazonense]
MAFELAPLPYAKDALQPYMSSETLDYHHGKHHNAYVTKLNELIAGTAFEGQSLEDIVKATAGKAESQAIFNNAGQHWNHTFFWNSLTPKASAIPGELEKRIIADFGSVEAFKKAFVDAGIGQFGSGWAWLVEDTTEGKLKITKSANADTPLAHGLKPLITADVWEHAYYIDYRNRRPDFLKTFVDTLANWEFAAQNLG